MNFKDALLLLALSSIWGASFLFMRVASPEFGPITLVFLRMSGAFITILPLLFNKDIRQKVFSNIIPLTLLALFLNALPFMLLAFATLRLDAGFTSLINATTPIWTAVVASLFFQAPIRKQQVFGLALAFLGVFVLSADKLTFTTGGTGWSILAGLGATASYGFASNYSKKKLSHLSSQEITLGALLSSSVILLIPGVYFWPTINPSMTSWASALLLGVVCTAMAFLLFFKILATAGSIATSTVTFLVPIFAIAWGVTLLDEVVTVRMLIGMAITLTGTALILQLFSLQKIFSRAQRQ